MNLESWNIIAEIVASVAVLISLWFLVLQLRGNLIQSKKQALDDLTLRRTELLKALYEDHDLASLIWRGFSQKPRLAAHEWARFGMYLYSLFIVFELTYGKYLSKDVDEVNWLSVLGATHWFLKFPGVRAWWASAPQGFTLKFVAMIDEELGKISQDNTSTQRVGRSFLEAAEAASSIKPKHSDNESADDV